MKAIQPQLPTLFTLGVEHFGAGQGNELNNLIPKKTVMARSTT